MQVFDRPSVIPFNVSVIIPTKNGGGQLSLLLKNIRSQKKVVDVEIIVIDSESTDNSPEIAKEFGAKVIQISQKEFNHGATRNLGAKESCGDFLIFTVQDAVPINNYYIYNMLCPFLQYPELSALSSRQFVKPEADLYNLWMNNTIVPFDMDVIYSTSYELDDTNWQTFDVLTKMRLTFFDNVSSCIKRTVFEEIQFAQLNFAEDRDYGVRLLEKKKSIGYLTSTGVFHWHERGADYILKRFYIGTKPYVYVLKNDLPYFFDKNNINWERLVGNIIGIYNLINISVSELKDLNPEAAITIRSFLNILEKNMNISPDFIKKIHKDKKVGGNNNLDLLLRQVFGDGVFLNVQQHHFKENFLIPYFMKYFGYLTSYLCKNHYTLKDREKEFISCLYKIFAMTAGEALGKYYLEAETLNRLTPELKRIDRLLGKGVCYF